LILALLSDKNLSGHKSLSIQVFLTSNTVLNQNKH